MKKERVDILLVERGLSKTREQAKRSIMAGIVFSGTERVDKPGTKVEKDIPLIVKGNPLPYVGRGGLKLEKAIALFDLSLDGKIGLDIGASTGGFTDCALQNGATLVYSLDVGYNQLDWKLRQDERVVVMERTNFRYVEAENFQRGLPEFATIDVSFISLKLILPVLKTILAPKGHVIALVKPQFEAGREQVGKKGIIRDKKVHQDVLERICEFSLEQGYDVHAFSFSPITGGEGNIEFLLHLYFDGEKKQGNMHTLCQVSDIVDHAHKELVAKNKE